MGKRNQKKSHGRGPSDDRERPVSGGLAAVAAHTPSFWDKVWTALKRLVPGSQEPPGRLLNPPEDQEHQGTQPFSSSSAMPPSRADYMGVQRSGHPEDSAELLKVLERVNQLETRVRKLEIRLEQSEDALGTDLGAKNTAADPYLAGASYDHGKPKTARYERVASPQDSVTLHALEEAICRFLSTEQGNWDVDRLLDSVQHSSGSSISPNVEHLGPHAFGEWRLVALWPQNSQQGLVLVSSGELVDDDVARYFDVSYGRRVIGCRQPARVSRSGGVVSVLRKGKVESS